MSAQTVVVQRPPLAADVAASPASRRRRPVVAVTAIAYFMVTLDALVVATALPSIHRELGGSAANLQWTVNAYTLAFATGIITASALGDRLGRRRVYRTGLLLFSAASAACALAPGLGWLIACRAVQGLGAAILMPLGMTLLTSAFPRERRGAAVGLWSGVAGLGVACGPLVGGAVTQGLDWHWIFWVNIPVGIVAWLGSRAALSESHGPRVGLDLPGMALIAVGVALAIWGLMRGPVDGWSNHATLAALILAAATLIGFQVRERHARTAMIPPEIFRSRRFAAAVLTTFLMAGVTFAAALVTSEYFQLARGDSPLGTGLRFLPWTAVPLLVAPIAGTLSDRVGTRRLAVTGLLMQAAGLAWIAALAHSGAGYASFVAPFLVSGVGVSMALPSVAAYALNAVPPAQLGRATGVLTTMQQLGAVAGITVTTVAFDAGGSLAGPAQVAGGYEAALPVAAGISVLAAIAATMLRKANR